MQSTSSRVVILGTGGTIAGTAASASDQVGYSAAQLGVAQLVAAVPELAGVPLEAEQLAQLDSKDMDHATWRALAQRVARHLERDEVAGVVVTHGTDTLEETAWFLQRVLAPRKPVVLCAAMRPATALSPDGPPNLRDAVRVAREPGARGVLAVLAGQVHGAAEVQKLHAYRIDAFGSGEAGPLACVEESRVRMLRAWPEGDALGLGLVQADPADWPRVEIVTSHAGAGGAIVEALCAQGVDGLVVAASGNGTVHHALESALLAAQRQGVAVLRATRCVFGRVIPVAGQALADAGGLNPVKARVELLLRLLAARLSAGAPCPPRTSRAARRT
ncbi:asparaginase [Caldimonas tepidiphila]|uniref:asparaginase n=1 Tax=Caldimonas tepidiphila TaxID=2315841 RepID=UPI000E5B5249|nr:asparaginase [Caldimonas tepidiphila]